MFSSFRRVLAAKTIQRGWRSYFRWKWMMRDVRLREQVRAGQEQTSKRTSNEASEAATQIKQPTKKPGNQVTMQPCSGLMVAFLFLLFRQNSQLKSVGNVPQTKVTNHTRTSYTSPPGAAFLFELCRSSRGRASSGSTLRWSSPSGGGGCARRTSRGRC